MWFLHHPIGVSLKLPVRMVLCAATKQMDIGVIVRDFQGYVHSEPNQQHLPKIAESI